MNFKEGKLTRPYSSKGTKKKDGIFISQDRYVAKILKKFRFTEVKNASTPMETQKPLIKDEDGEEVDVHIYRYQVNPKVSHLHDVKRIFSTVASAIIYLATNQKFNFSKWIFNNMIRNLDNMSGTFLMCPRVGKGFSGRVTHLFPTMVVQYELGEGSSMPIDPYHTSTILQSSSSQPQKTHKPRKPTRKVTQVPQPSDHMEHVTYEAVHKELTDSGGGSRCQEAIGNTIAQTRRVKKLEKRNRSRTHKLKILYKVGFTTRVESFKDEESLGEDAFKHGRIEAIDQDEDIALVNDQDDA
uniref:Uncharacterized protein n=1 Tax=Tanacetum cinerariifolium TaxID=118510 RepID=A0A6L2N0I8_TANCI|nr:hypothetical protein [Tanacetum cinerariifolium]